MALFLPSCIDFLDQLKNSCWDYPLHRFIKQTGSENPGSNIKDGFINIKHSFETPTALITVEGKSISAIIYNRVKLYMLTLYSVICQVYVYVCDTPLTYLYTIPVHSRFQIFKFSPTSNAILSQNIDERKTCFIQYHSYFMK